ncbi:MAG TPA: DUF5671 domain-containing protein [Candidatus Saccharimonadales bacterium]|nr:DUF5671 domain-containing protein [Candidatus Saccharimonadales bacterium]
MSEDLQQYIRRARESGADHQTIKDRLVGAGWHPRTVSEAMQMHGTGGGQGSDGALSGAGLKPHMPIAVVKAYTTRGMEYYLMMIALTVSALSLGLVLHTIFANLFDDSGSYVFGSGLTAFASAALIVTLPIFGFFFLRLKRAELHDRSLLIDPSRRRAVQIMLFISFIVGIISTISYVFAFISLSYGSAETEGVKLGPIIADFITSLLIIGGIFMYYWFDSHRKGDL